MRQLVCIVAIGFAVMTTSCADGKFSKAAGQSPSEPSAVAEETPTSADEAPIATDTPATTSSETPAASTSAPLIKAEDKTALDECAKQWGKTPFTAEQLARPKVVDINDTVNNNGIIFTDAKKTDVPTLFLINFNINVGNNGELQFLNPKGWYCFNVKAKVINNFVIKTACDTHTAIVSKLAQNDKNFTISREEPCPTPAP